MNVERVRLIAICCPNALVADGLVRTLSGHGYTAEVFDTVDSLLAAVSNACPDIVLIDHALVTPGTYPIDEVAGHGCKVVILADPIVDQGGTGPALQAGARGYLSMNDPPERFMQSLEMVLTGAVVVSPRLGELVWRPPPEPPVTVPELSPREIRVATMIARGMETKEIAEELSVSEHTVKSQIGSILTKLDLRNRAEIAAYAALHGFLDVKPTAIP